VNSVESVQLTLDAPIQPRAPGCPIPLMPGQMQFLKCLARNGRALSQRVCASAVRVHGPFQSSLLETSIQAVVHRHESLRTRISEFDGKPRQHVESASTYHLDRVDLSHLPPTDSECTAGRLAQEFLDEKVDLYVGPLFDARLWKLSERDHVLILAIDHIVADAVSYGILCREVWTLYNHAVQGLPSPLPPLLIQFGDYAVWEQRTRVAWIRKHAAYWTDRFVGAHEMRVPTDNASTEVTKLTAATMHIPFENTRSAKLREVARREGTLLPLLVLTIYCVVLSHWCKQEDLVIPFLLHGRHRRRELENLIGLLVRSLYLRIPITQAESFSDLLLRVRQEFSSGYSHEGSHFIPEIGSACNSEFIFNWQPAISAKGIVDHHLLAEWASQLNWESPLPRNFAANPLRTEKNLEIQPFSVRDRTTIKFSPIFYDTATAIHLVVSYAGNLFESSTIEWFGRALLSVSDEIVERPSIGVATLSARLHDVVPARLPA
jgi:Condensation domain